MVTKTKAPAVKTPDCFAEDINMPNTYLKDAVFDLSGLAPMLNKENGQLVLSVPAFESKSPMLNHVFVDDLKEAGLTDMEIEEASDTFFMELEKKMFVKLLTARMVK